MSSLFPSLTTTAQRIVNQDQAKELEKKKKLSPVFVAPAKPKVSVVDTILKNVAESKAQKTEKQSVKDLITKPQEVDLKGALRVISPTAASVLDAAGVKNPEPVGGLFGSLSRAVPGSIYRFGARIGAEFTPEGNKARKEGIAGPVIPVEGDYKKALIGQEPITTLSSGPVAKTGTEMLETLGVPERIAKVGGLFPSIGFGLALENPIAGGPAKTGGKILKETAEQIAKRLAKESAEKIAKEGGEEVATQVSKNLLEEAKNFPSAEEFVKKYQVEESLDLNPGVTRLADTSETGLYHGAGIINLKSILNDGKLKTNVSSLDSVGEKVVSMSGNRSVANSYGVVFDLKTDIPKYKAPKSAIKGDVYDHFEYRTNADIPLSKVESVTIPLNKGEGLDSKIMWSYQGKNPEYISARELQKQFEEKGIKVFFDDGSNLTKSSLTDIWNKENNVAKESAEKIAKEGGEEVTTQVSKNLLDEAKKYKSADEFVALDRQSLGNPGILEKENRNTFAQTVKTKENATKLRNDTESRLFDVTEEIQKQGGRLMADSHLLIEKRDLVETLKALDEVEPSLKTKSQLTDLWNKENNVAKETLDTSKLPKIEQTRIAENPELGTAAKIEELRSRTRGVVSDVDAQAAAKTLGYDKNKVLNEIPIGTALNKEQKLAVSGVVNASRDSLTALESQVPIWKEALNGGDKVAADAAQLELNSFAKRKIEHMKLIEVERGIAAEAGRALQGHKQIADSITDQEARLGKYLSGLGDSADDIAKKNYIYDAIGKFDGDSKEMADLLKKLNESTAMEKFVEFATAIKLTAIPTHLTNMITTAGRVIADIPVRGVSGILDSTFGRLYGGSRERFVREIGAEARGQLLGWQTGWGDVLNALKDEKFTSESKFVKDAMNKGPAIKGRLGKDTAYDKMLDFIGPKIRAPFRLLGVEDLIFRKPAFMGDLFVQAERSALQKGLKSDTEEYAKYVSEYIYNPDLKAIEGATEKADVSLFQKKAGPLTEKLNKIRNEFPSSKLVLPFMNGVANLIKTGIEFTPLAPILKDTRTALKARGPAMDALAKMTLGTAAMIPFVNYAIEDKITLDAPKNTAERDAWYASGKQPYSIKIGEKWYPYGRFSPFADTITYAALIGKAVKDEDKQGFTTNLQAAALGMLTNVLDKSFVQGLSDMLNALTDPTKGEKWWQNLITGSTIPTIVSRAAQSMDPVVREANGLKEAFMAKLPGLSDNLKSKLDVFGEDIMRPGTPLQRFVSPSVPSIAEIDTVRRELENLDVQLSFPSQKAFGQDLSADQYHELKVISGKMTYKILNALVTNPEFQKLPFQDRQKAVETTISKVREAARTKVAPEFAIQKRIQELIKKKGPSLTDEQVQEMSNTVYTNMQLNKLKQTQ